MKVAKQTSPFTTPSPEFFELQTALAGRYSLEREIGRGGMAVVFLARDIAHDRLVAIKLLRRELALDGRARERFMQEARTAARLFHPNIVPVHSVEAVGDAVFLVMAYVDGETLGQRVRRAGSLSPIAVRRVMQEVAWALDHAHGEGVIHLDVKPDNILLERRTGRAMVTDFGIARVAAEPAAGSADELLGTLHYMSPEQLAGGTVDARSDVYSLGVTAYFALTARVPEPAGTAERRGGRAGPAAVVPTAISAAGVPARLGAVIHRCLRRDPGERWPSAAELAGAVAETEANPFRMPLRGRQLVRQLRQFAVIATAGTGLLLFGPQVRISMPLVLVMVGVVAHRMVRGAREVLRQGFDRELVSRILSDEIRELAEARGQPRRWSPAGLLERARNFAIRAGFPIVGAMTAAAGALYFFRPELLGPEAIGALVLLATVLLGAGPAVPEGSPLRALDWGERLVTGRFGRFLFAAAGIGLPRSQRQPAVGQPTEVILAAAVEDMFQKLPVRVRGRFADLPAVVRHLEQHVQTLRRHDQALADALARIDLPEAASDRTERERLHQELESARARASERLRAAVAALEHLRVSMSRLAGDATDARLDRFTSDVQRAREIGRTLDGTAALPEAEARRWVTRAP